MAAPPPDPSPAPPKSGTARWLLLGAAGCIVALLLGAAVLAVGGILVARKGASAAARVTVQKELVTQEVTLSAYLTGDDTRTERMRKVYGELEKQAEVADLDEKDVAKIWTEIESDTKDDHLTAEEADRVLDLAESVAGTK
jgi:hypothetical protein